MKLTEKDLQEQLTPDQYEKFCRIRETDGLEEALMSLPDMGNGLSFSCLNGRIKELRLQHGLTQTELATILDLSQREYWRYEQDGYNPNILSLASLARFYNVSLDWFAGLINEQKPIASFELCVKGYTLSAVKKAKAEGKKITPNK